MPRGATPQFSTSDEPKPLEVPGFPGAGEQRLAGFVYALSAYLWWGFIPIYFKLLVHIAPLVVLAHRVVWSLVFLLAIIALQRRWREAWQTLTHAPTLAKLTATAILVAVNWYTFIWAITHHQALQASLGYFINPVVTVVLALVFLGERLRPWQWVAVGLAAVAVVNLAVLGDAFPWVALILALSFGLYGLIRKVVAVGPLIGLLIETIALTPAAAAVLWHAGGPAWADHPGGTQALLAVSGIATALPLLWFAAGARRLPLSTMGFLQYAGPTVQFFVALWVFQEPLEPQKLVSFAIIWAALVIYSIDTLAQHRHRQIILELPD